MAYFFAFWFPPRGHNGGMPTSAKRQSACTRTCLCASSTEARLGPIRVPGRSSSRSDVFLCIPNARPRSSHTGDAAALQPWPTTASSCCRTSLLKPSPGIGKSSWDWPTQLWSGSGVVHRFDQVGPPLEPALWLCALPVIRLVALRNHCCREPQANICLSSEPQIH